MNPVSSSLPTLSPEAHSSPEASGGDATPRLQEIGPDNTNQRPLAERRPVSVPRLNIGLPVTPASQYEQSDNSPCYALTTGCVHNPGYLTATAAQALKSAHPESFGSFPDYPSHGDDWHVLMRARGEGQDFARQDIIARFIFQAKVRGGLDEVLTEPDSGWYATEIPVGVRRTGSVQILTVPEAGEYVSPYRDEYLAKKENERLQVEVEMLREQFDKSVTLLNLLHKTVNDPRKTAEEAVGMLQRVLRSATNQGANNAVTYESLIRVYGQLSGGHGLRAEASLEPFVRESRS